MNMSIHYHIRGWKDRESIFHSVRFSEFKKKLVSPRLSAETMKTGGMKFCMLIEFRLRILYEA